MKSVLLILTGVTAATMFVVWVAIRPVNSLQSLLGQIDTPPSISLTIETTSKRLENGVLQVRPGTAILPTVRVADDNDPNPIVTIECGNQRVPPGEKVVLASLGYFECRARAIDSAGNEAVSIPVGIVVNEMDQLRAQAAVESCQIHEASAGTIEIDLVILLTSEDFDVKQIYLSHVSLWPIGESGGWLDGAGQGRMQIAGAYPEKGKFNEGTAEAEYDSSGFWRLRFKGILEGRTGLPAAFELTGTGWTTDGEYFNFDARTKSTNPEPDAVQSMKQFDSEVDVHDLAEQ
ncbi:MAG: hypothetical protein L0Y44_05660 [Phycisphaerales bacterium]|nr:hypothetical protein [Phycisphaerales bacterium]MCI0676330.1 hypothetical protein [Phycisphaerales bacterium]